MSLWVMGVMDFPNEVGTRGVLDLISNTEQLNH